VSPKIGAGEGIITAELLRKARKVVAFEPDTIFFDKLSNRFRGEKSLELKNLDFLTINLPNHAYKVFSNIPFNITSQIIKKLLFDKNSPVDSYIVIQKESASRFSGRPMSKKNDQIAVLLHPWFEFSSIYEFSPDDFFPKPGVEVILLRIIKREEPLVAESNKRKYWDFTTYIFNRQRQKIVKLPARPSEINFSDWLRFFDLFLKKSAKEQDLIGGAYIAQLRQQERLDKIHRTRVAKDWLTHRSNRE